MKLIEKTYVVKITERYNEYRIDKPSTPIHRQPGIGCIGIINRMYPELVDAKQIWLTIRNKYHRSFDKAECVYREDMYREDGQWLYGLKFDGGDPTETYKEPFKYRKPIGYFITDNTLDDHLEDEGFLEGQPKNLYYKFEYI